jgi:hypothetical protein
MRQMTKKCTKCAITKSYDDFYKSKVNLDGLHVPSNLQLLTKHDNCSKGAKYEQR